GWPMSLELEGDLQRIRLPKVLVAVGCQNGNGILTVQGMEDIVAVSFVQGSIVTADALNQTVEEGLGKVLQSKGLISAEDFATAARDYQGGSTGSLGDLLVERNLISRESLLEALRLQTFRSMLQLLTWKHGDFKFYSGDEVSYEDGFVPISVDELLLRAVDKLGEKAGLLGSIPDLDTVYRTVPPRGPVNVIGRDGDGLGAGIWISPLHGELMSRLDGQRTGGETVREMGLDRFQALYGLYLLTQQDLVEGTGRKAGMGTGAVPSLGPGAGRASAPTFAPGSQAEGSGAFDSIPFGDETASRLGPSPFAPPGTGAVPAPRGVAAEVFSPPPPAAAIRRDAEAAERPTSASGELFLEWGGLALAVLLLVAVAATMASRPVSLLLPFPWQESSRSTAERQMRESLFQRIDRSARTFFLMEAHYPDALEELGLRSMLSAEDLRDPAGHQLEYSADSVSYRIQLRQNGQALEGLGNTEAITGDFLVDPQFLSSASSAEAPLVLLD
ncbi:MAG: DUF4388 domain-containing protein, partial [Holophagales bacterium]|nr:DUF4388 domain-containing protein [Holophagales bacterium]